MPLLTTTLCIALEIPPALHIPAPLDVQGSDSKLREQVDSADILES